MNIKSLFKNKDTIYLDQNFTSKEEVLKFFANELVSKNYAIDSSKIYELFLAREKQSSTGIGDFIAMPHFGDEEMKQSTLLFARVNNLDWNALDQKPVKYIFGIALSKNQRESGHIEIMQQLSSLLLKPEFIASLDKVKTSEEFLALFDAFETKDVAETEGQEGTYDIVAVTACPTGIAHTFLAKEKLVEQAKKMNLRIKVETQGAEGVKNALSTKDIANAKGIILATDREIEKGKFANATNVLEISTQKAIYKTKEQIEQVLANKGTKVKVGKANDESFAEMSFDGFVWKLRRALMSGISHMLPFIVFGGILLAIGFLLDIIIGGINKTDINSPVFLSNFGFNAPISKIVFDLGKIGLNLAVPILAAYITYALVGRQGLLPGFVVGAIASGQLSSTYGFLNGAIKASNVANPEAFAGTGSGFIGGILGAFFAAAMVIVFSKYIFGKLPQTMQGIKNILFIPLLGTLTIAILFWVANIALIFVNLGLVLFLGLFEANPKLAWILGLILGAMMAIDLGGPVNKAAYIFGTLTIAGGKSSVSMAAVMAAGMVPPLGIALSMFISKKLWTKEEINSGKYSNILFGISFISEGAIPYTSKNPKVLVPSNVIGGAVAGILSASLGVNIIAPHGGIFVGFLARSNLFSDFGTQVGMGIVFWILAILAGAMAQAGAIIFFSKLNQKHPNWLRLKRAK
ncbi:fructose permease IIC protein [Mycoplasmopsis bovirhinis]|uniref:PTS fructose transporter subunit IIABC n=1 Tax=Mycoplasmopsis bovirhinis TaxID=29553 RepID=UPI000C059D86|nr:fructose-specific PTS transporter subunit EIIC [Mycoplasmopsis bovirhinis]ATO30663.1 fructose permease IIC protein [Mycoplasmopsis bovirhinis]